MSLHWDTGEPLSKAETNELRRLNGKHRDIRIAGAAVLERQAEKKERQDVMTAFVSAHSIGCFKCGATSTDWAKTGSSLRGPWCLCLNCVRNRR